MESRSNSHNLVLNANFVGIGASGSSPKAHSIDCLTGEFFEDLQGVINECESSLLASHKEMEDLESEGSGLSIMEHQLSLKITKLSKHNNKLRARLFREKCRLQKINLRNVITGNSRKTAKNCKD